LSILPSTPLVSTGVSGNSGARRLKGYEREEIIGQPYFTFFTQEDRDRSLPQKALETAASESRFETEGWRIRKDGSEFCASVVIDAVRNESGALIGFAKVTRDITEREEARRRLIESDPDQGRVVAVRNN